MCKIYLVKPICSWDNSKNLVKNWFSKMSENPELCQTGNIRMIDGETEKPDYYIIINYPSDNTSYEPDKTIVFQAEPWCEQNYQKWGVKTWGAWSKPDQNVFLQVRNHRTYLNILHWEIEKTLPELLSEKIEKTSLISTVTTSKYFDPGHITRIDLLKKLENENFILDIYGYDNHFNFKGYKGPHKHGNKNEGILPYKYYIHCENNSEYNFITEKIWDSILAECVIFYWGCPNISEYIDPACYILLDRHNHNKNYSIIKNAIENNEWEKRIEKIRAEKIRILKQYNVFNITKQIIASKEETPVDIWIHCCSKNYGMQILQEQLNRIRKSGLYNRLRKIYIGIVGPYENLPCFSSDKITVLKMSDTYNETEFKTVKTFLKDYLDPKSYLLYIHTKGVSHPNCKKSKDWRNMMEYFLIDNWENCLEVLKTSDITGCNLQYKKSEKTTPTHFSGNFWFAKGEYLEKIRDKLGKKFYFYNTDLETYVETPISLHLNSFPCVEFWVADNDWCKAFCLHDSNINHYLEEYDESCYKNKL